MPLRKSLRETEAGAMSLSFLTLFLWQPAGRPDHSQMAGAPAEIAVERERAFTVAEHVIVLHVHEFGRTGILRERVRRKRMWVRQHHILIEALVHPVRDDRGALGHVCTDPAAWSPW